MQADTHTIKRTAPIAGLIVVLVTVGTVGFRLLTGETWLECLYQSVIFLTTVGSHEPSHLTPTIQIFVIGYLVAGLGIFSYAAFQIGQWILESRLRELVETRRMQKEIAKLRGHFVVCGTGRMGEIICQRLAERKRPFVAIEIDEARAQALREQNDWLVILGDATDDDVLLKAGIERAEALAAVLPGDADNVYTVLAARMLNPSLQIIARAKDEKAAGKLKHAGANRVVSPVSSGAIKIARFLLNPSIEDFLEIAGTSEKRMELADVLITENSPYAGKELRQTDLRDRGIMVIGIRKADGGWLMTPSGSAKVEAGDCLFVIGNTDAVAAMIDESERGG